MIHEKRIVEPLIKAEQTAHHAIRARKNLGSAGLQGLKPLQQQGKNGRQSDPREQHLVIPEWDREHPAGKQISPSSAEKRKTVQ